MNYSKKRGLPIVTLVILALNLTGLIYELIEGQSTAIYRFGMYQGALADGGWPRLMKRLWMM